MKKPVYPTVPTAYLFQAFANLNWKLYGHTEGKHMGIDIGVVSGVPGSPVYAVYDGKVTEAGYFDQGGYGRRIVIEHENGEYSTLYAHQKDVLVKNGDVVVTGQQIGTMGGNLEDKLRGASGGTHLHFEVILSAPVRNSIRTFKGWCVDPIPYLMNRYFPAPINAIKITSGKGLRVRVGPNVVSESVTSLFHRDVFNVMEVLADKGAEQWVKLWSLRDEYCALKYNGLVNAELVSPLIVTPVDDPTPDPVLDPLVSPFMQGFANAVEKMKVFLDGMK